MRGYIRPAVNVCLLRLLDAGLDFACKTSLLEYNTIVTSNACFAY